MTYKRFQTPLLLVAMLGLGNTVSHAAKAPLSPGKLEAQATHIVSGTVLEVRSKVQNSEIEKGAGHRDRVFTIKLKVASVSKGAKVKVGDEIVVMAWKPVSRLPQEPGLQGHSPLPAKGDQVKMFLTGGERDPFEPLLPNGIVIEKSIGTPIVRDPQISPG